MYNTPQDLLDALRATPDTIQALLYGVTHAQAAVARGGDENWSVVEVVCHLRDAEERALERMRSMRDLLDPVMAGYDQARWAVERNYAATDLRVALSAFLLLRATHVTELAGLNPEQWERTGQHVELGSITITSHTLHMVSHDAIHSAQIARQLK
jgi:hypothetical protein